MDAPSALPKGPQTLALPPSRSLTVKVRERRREPDADPSTLAMRCRPALRGMATVVLVRWKAP